jgi:hypothetical protein
VCTSVTRHHPFSVTSSCSLVSGSFHFVSLNYGSGRKRLNEFSRVRFAEKFAEPRSWKTSPTRREQQSKKRHELEDWQTRRQGYFVHVIWLSIMFWKEDCRRGKRIKGCREWFKRRHDISVRKWSKDRLDTKNQNEGREHRSRDCLSLSHSLSMFVTLRGQKLFGLESRKWGC